MIRPDTNPAQAAETDTTTDAIVMYTTTWCGDCRRAKRVFADFGVPYVEVNIESDEDAAELVQTLNNGARSVPTIVFPDGGILVEPSNATLMTKLQQYIPAAR
ncbi:MAG TPA: glutaredoxin domain-containing protein [Ktedonobacterales bacterium]|nr:glutaredoxin domain-containing protein [Ktedonobacterales bacterium]